MADKNRFLTDEEVLGLSNPSYQGRDSKNDNYLSDEELIEYAGDISSIGQFDLSTPYTTLGKYDEDLVYGQDQRLFRATHQPWTHQAGNAVVGGIGGGVLTAIEDAGYILDFKNHIERAKGLEEIESNWLSDIAKGLKEDLTQDVFPIYRKSDELIDWSDSGFYWEALRGVLDSAVGFGAVGLGTGALVKGAFKLGSSALRGKRVSAFLSQIAPYIDDAAGKGQQFTAAYITNFGEGKMMALEMYERAVDEIAKANPNMPISQVRRIAGNRADDFMMMNKAFILTDAFALSGLSRGINSTRAKARDLSWKSFAKSFGEVSTKNPLAQASAESLEEIGQNVAQMEAEYQAKKDAGMTPEGIPTTMEERLIKFATSDQALLEGAMGFFGGPIQYGIIQGPQDFANRKTIRKRASEQAEQLKNNATFISEKLSNYLDIHNAVEESIQKGEQFNAEQLKSGLFMEVALDNFERGTTDQLERSLEDIRDNKQLAEQAGLGENYQEDVNKQLAELQEMEADYIRTKRKYANPIFTPLHRDIFKEERALKRVDQRLSEVTNKYNSLKQNIVKTINDQSAEVVNSAVAEIPMLTMERNELERNLQINKSVRDSIIKRNALVDRNEKRGIPNLIGKTPTNRISRIINTEQTQIDELNKKIEQNKEIVNTVETPVPSTSLKKYVNNLELNKLGFEKNLLGNEKNEISETLGVITNPENARALLETISKDARKNIDKKAEKERTDQDQITREAKAERAAQDKVGTQEEEGAVGAPLSKEEERAIEEQIAAGAGPVVVDPKKQPKIIRASNQPAEEDDRIEVSQDGGQSIPSENVITTTTQKQTQEDFNDVIHNLIKQSQDVVATDIEAEPIGPAEEGKINFSHSALAYLSRDYIEYLTLSDGRISIRLKDDGDKLSSELRDPKLLSIKEYQPGTKLTLFLDKEYKKARRKKTSDPDNIERRRRKSLDDLRPPNSSRNDNNSNWFAPYYDISTGIEIVRGINASSKEDLIKAILSAYDKEGKEGEDTYETLLRQGREVEAAREKPTTDNEYNDRTYDYIPIGIRSQDGLTIGYLHNVDFPPNRTKEQNVDEDINTIRAIRNALVKEHDGTYETTVTEKRLGKIAITKDRKPMDLSEAMKDPNLIVGISTSEGIINNKGKNIPITNKTLRPGVGYAFVALKEEDGITQYVGIPLLSKRLNEEYRGSLLSAINIYLSNDTSSPLAQTMFDSGYNLATTKDLKTYVRRFMGLANLPQDTFLREFILTDNSSNGYVDIRGDSVEAGMGKGEKYITSFVDKGTGERVYYTGLGVDDEVILKQRIAEKEEQKQAALTDDEMNQVKDELNAEFGKGVSRRQITREDFINRLGKILDKSYYHINSDSLKKSSKDDSFNVPIIAQDGSVNNNTESYTEFVKRTHETNVIDFDLGDGEYTSFVQPIIRFETPSISNVETAGASGQVIIVSQEKEKPTYTDDEVGLTVDPRGFLFAAPAGTVAQEVDESIARHRLEGLSAREQEEMIASFAYSIFSDLIEQGKGRTMMLSSAFEKIKVHLNVNLRSQLAGLDQKTRLKYNQRIDNLLSQWDKVQALTTNRVRQIRGVKDHILIREEEANSGVVGNKLDAPYDIDDYNEKVDYNRSSLELDPKDSTSVRLKRFLAGIPDIDAQTGRNRLNTYIPYHKFVPYDQIYAEISGVMAGGKPNYDKMITRLNNYVGRKPYMKNVIELLENSEDQVKTEFASEMAKHQVYMKMINMIYKDKSDTYDSRVVDSNRSSFAETISNEWKSDFISTSDKLREGSPYFSKEDGDRISQEYRDLNKLVDDRPLNVTDKSADWLEDSIDALDSWLSNFGIDVDNNMLGDILANRRRWEFHTRTGKGVFDILNRRASAAKQPTLEDSNFFEQTAVKRFARMESQYRSDVFTQSYRTGDKKTIYNYSYNKLFIDRFFSLKEDADLKNRLSNNYFNKHSFWLRELQNPNSDLSDVFNYFYFDSFKQGRRNGRTGKNLSDAEMEIAELGLFTNNGITRNNGETRIVNMLHPTMGERRPMGVTTVGVDTRLNLDGSDIHEDISNVLFNEIVLPEIERILAFQDKKEVDIGGKDGGFNKGSKKFLLTPGLNFDMAPDNLKGIWEDKGTKLKSMDELKENYFTPLKEYMRGEVDRLAKEKIEAWKEFGIINKEGDLKYVDNKYLKQIAKERVTSKGEGQLPLYVARDFVVNSLVSNANFYKLFIGDPALFWSGDIMSTFNNIGKRLTMYTGPGRAIASDDVYTQAIFDDRVASSLNKELAKIPEYVEIETTDSQEYTTMSEHLFILEKMGLISKDQKKRFMLQSDKGTLSREDMEFLLFASIDNPMVPIKPLYSNLIQDDEYPTERPVLIKSASIPLIPQLTKGFEIDKLRRAMEDPNNNISRLAFQSAVKSGDRMRKENRELFNSDGTIVDNIIFDGKNTLRLPREGLRIQQQVIVGKKSTVTDGSQQRKLIFTDLMHLPQMKERYERYNRAYGELFAMKADQFMDKYTREEEGQLVFLIDNVRRDLRDEAIRRNYSNNDIDILSMGNEDFLNYIIFSESSARVENLLNSLTDNGIRKNKVPGFSAALVSEEGWRFKSLISSEPVTETSRRKEPTAEELGKRSELEKRLGELQADKRQVGENRNEDVKETEDKLVYVGPTVPTIKQTKGKTVTMPVTYREDGETVDEEVPALEARNDLTARLKVLEKLTDCVK